MTYNWQQPDWPEFTYVLEGVEHSLLTFVQRVGRMGGLIEGLAEEGQTESIINMMVLEAVKTSEIEGEYLSRMDVLSSIRNNLGLSHPLEQVRDRRAEGVAALMTNLRDTYAASLSESMLLSWHTMLMKGSRVQEPGRWRYHTEPMQVVSGAMEKGTVHFEAPPSERVPREMDDFITWFNATGPKGPKPIQSPLVRSAIAHLYFESIHPFEDCNGRIGRVIAEKALSQGMGQPVLLSLSKTIEADKQGYYTALQLAQQSNELTPWITYFVEMILEAQIEAEEQVHFTLKKAKFFDRFAGQLNERQLRVLRRMLEEGPQGFEGGMSAKKYMAIAKTSKPTATRDLQALVKLGALESYGGGRSVRYKVAL